MQPSVLKRRALCVVFYNNSHPFVFNRCHMTLHFCRRVFHVHPAWCRLQPPQHVPLVPGTQQLLQTPACSVLKDLSLPLAALNRACLAKTVTLPWNSAQFQKPSILHSLQRRLLLLLLLHLHLLITLYAASVFASSVFKAFNVNEMHFMACRYP